MAKELPFFKFEPSQWDNGNIQLCSFEAKGVFISVCSMYWQRLGDVPYKLAVQKICNGNAAALDSLIEEDVVKVIGGLICIDFLNEQLSEFENISHTNSENARSGWEKRRINATAKQSQSEGNAIREEKKREDEKKEENINNAAAKAATIETRKSDFMNKVSIHLDTYGKEMLREFFDYWTEMNDKGKKMRFEMEKVFDINRRLKTWAKNLNFRSNGTIKSTKLEQDRNRLSESMRLITGKSEV